MPNAAVLKASGWAAKGSMKLHWIKISRLILLGLLLRAAVSSSARTPVDPTSSQSSAQPAGTSGKSGATVPGHAAGAPASGTKAAPTAVPKGMAWIPAAEFWMGSDEAMFKDARPWHQVYLDGFFIDKTVVTNEQFARFVKATGYVTIAEKKPRAEDYPGAPPENLVAGSVVFTPPDHPVPLNDQFQWWSYVKGANWKHPGGPNTSLTGKERHPVVHIAYKDADAYCKWEGKRLPTEAEFEFAERGGLDRKKYAWGDQFMPNGKAMANTFQGHFPDKNTEKDGYAGTSPVGSFPANGYGLYDMSGNVWEWTSDWYRPDYYQTLASTGKVARNPQGPSDSFDPSEPGVAKKVHRAGSYLCTDQYCSRYMVGGRGKGEPDTGTNHLGFRCVETPQVVGKKNNTAQARQPGVPAPQAR